MIILNCDQGTDDWKKVRCGIPTASNFDKIVKMDGSKSAQQKKYMYKLAGEFVSGNMADTYQNADMLRGIELEASARNQYILETKNEVQEVGFCSDDTGSYGCSPDGLVGEDGGIEIKCPSIAVHVEYLLDNKLPSEYFQQVQGCLYVTGRKWWDFVSYCPGIRTLIVRVLPDTKFFKALDVELNEFCSELQKTITTIKGK